MGGGGTSDVPLVVTADWTPVVAVDVTHVVVACCGILGVAPSMAFLALVMGSSTGVSWWILSAGGGGG